MAQSIVPADHAPVVRDFMIVSVSVSSSASAVAAGVGPFRGLFFRTSSSVTISQDGNTVDLNDVAKNTILWIQGSFVAVIATATNVYAVR